MDLDNIIKENKILAALALITILGVLCFDVFHYSLAYGIVEINPLTALFLVPFIVSVFGLGVMLGATKQTDAFTSAYHKRLTEREKEVISHISQGKKNKEIAEELFVDISTVKSHINRIYKKTGVNNRKELVEITGRVLK